MTWGHWRNGLLCGFLLVGIIVGLQISFLLAQAAEMFGAVQRDLSQTSHEARQAIFQLRNDAAILTAQGTRSLGIATGEIAATKQLLDIRTDALLQLVHAQAEDLKTMLSLTIQHFDADHAMPLQQNANTLIVQTLDTERRIGDFVEESRNLVFDCQGNPGCLENRIMNVSSAAQRMTESAATMAQAAEKNVASMERITSNIEITTNAVRNVVEPKKGFWGRFWRGVQLAAGLGARLIL